MAKGIDFLEAQKRAGLKKAKLLFLLKVGSIVFLIFYCLTSTAVLSFWLHLKQENNRVNQQVMLKKQKIEELRKTESLQFILKQRLSALGRLFFEKRTDYVKLLSYFEEVSLPGIDLGKLVLSEKGTVTVSGTAANPFILSSFLERLVSSTPPSPFSKIILSSLNRQKNGGYNFSLSCNIHEQS